MRTLDRTLDDGARGAAATRPREALDARGPAAQRCFCPSCSRALETRSCKLRCPACGYFEDCSNLI